MFLLNIAKSFFFHNKFLQFVSFLILLAVAVYEYVFNYIPCELCVYQRLPWALIFISSYFLSANYSKYNYIICLFLSFFSIFLGFFHAGVEYQLWEGLSSCSGNDNVSGNLTDLLSNIDKEVIPSCSNAVWTMFGISLAGYNGLMSLMIFCYCFFLLKFNNKS